MFPLVKPRTSRPHTLQEACQPGGLALDDQVRLQAETWNEVAALEEFRSSAQVGSQVQSPTAAP